MCDPARAPREHPLPKGDRFGVIAFTARKAAAPSESRRGSKTAAIDRCLRGRRIIPSSSGRIRVALTLAGFIHCLDLPAVVIFGQRCVLLGLAGRREIGGRRERGGRLLGQGLAGAGGEEDQLSFGKAMRHPAALGEPGSVFGLAGAAGRSSAIHRVPHPSPQGGVRAAPGREASRELHGRRCATMPQDMALLSVLPAATRGASPLAGKAGLAVLLRAAFPPPPGLPATREDNRKAASPLAGLWLLQEMEGTPHETAFPEPSPRSAPFVIQANPVAFKLPRYQSCSGIRVRSAPALEQGI